MSLVSSHPVNSARELCGWAVTCWPAVQRLVDRTPTSAVTFVRCENLALNIGRLPWFGYHVKAIVPCIWRVIPEHIKTPAYLSTRVVYSTRRCWSILYRLGTKEAMPTSGTNCQPSTLVHCICSTGSKFIINKQHNGRWIRYKCFLSFKLGCKVGQFSP